MWYGHIDVIFSSPKLHVEVSEGDLENEMESLNISGSICFVFVLFIFKCLRLSAHYPAQLS